MRLTQAELIELMFDLLTDRALKRYVFSGIAEIRKEV
jgi:hypothetical protein